MKELNMRKRWIFLAPMAILGILLFMAIGGGIVLQLWNWLLPPIFGLPRITFWQALGILALCRILFGGFGRHGSFRSRFRRPMGERWEQMTPEERERFRQGLRGRCDFAPSTGQSKEQGIPLDSAQSREPASG
jgi:hypothetical protein